VKLKGKQPRGRSRSRWQQKVRKSHIQKKKEEHGMKLERRTRKTYKERLGCNMTVRYSV
jgi:hypothetical protein